MRFLLDDEQREFAHSVDALLSASDTPAAARAWAEGDHAPGRALWSRLAGTGLFALSVPEEYDGLGPLAPESAIAFVELGRHAVPGPLVEHCAAAVLLAELGDPALAKDWLPRLASAETVATLTDTRYALDADAADAFLTIHPDGDRLLLTDHGELLASTDPARRLSTPSGGGTMLASGESVRRAAARSRQWAQLLTAAQSLGVARALLDQTVAYVQQRKQFGTAIGTFQAVKHRLADALLAIEFAQPLLHAAALSLDPREIAMAKTSCGEAAYATARTALQLHGAIGYTEELDLSLWLRKARPLREAWGSPAECRELVTARRRKPPSRPGGAGGG